MSNRFVFLVPCYNAEKTIARMLMSVFLQTYQNFLILIHDDLSTDGTVSTIRRICERNDVAFLVREKGVFHYENEGDGVTVFGDVKVIVDVNAEKKWEVKNALEMINHPLVQETDVLCRLDGDDSLIELCALQDLNMIYEQTGADFVYSGHRWTGTEQVVDHGNNIYSVHFYNDSKPYPPGADPYKSEWCTSHFKTFRKSLLTGVKDENYRGEDGEYVRRAGDRCIVYPALKNAKKVVYFPRATYLYTIDPRPQTFASDDAKFQKEEAEYLMRRGYIGNNKNKKGD